MGTGAIIAIAIGVVMVIAVIVGIIMNSKLNKERDRILEEGEHTHGWIVQANDELFKKGDSDMPALIVVSPDEETNDDEEFMTELTESISTLKGQDPDDVADAGEAKVAELMADESYVEGRRDKLPKSFTDGKKVYLVHVYVFREHLRNKRLSSNPKLPCAIVWDEPESLVCSRPMSKKKRKREDDDE